MKEKSTKWWGRHQVSWGRIIHLREVLQRLQSFKTFLKFMTLTRSCWGRLREAKATFPEAARQRGGGKMRSWDKTRSSPPGCGEAAVVALSLGWAVLAKGIPGPAPGNFTMGRKTARACMAQPVQNGSVAGKGALGIQLARWTHHLLWFSLCVVGAPFPVTAFPVFQKLLPGCLFQLQDLQTRQINCSACDHLCQVASRASPLQRQTQAPA